MHYHNRGDVIIVISSGDLDNVVAIKPPSLLAEAKELPLGVDTGGEKKSDKVAGLVDNPF
jgi:hypothetical protein